jgi:hypothetical protein
MRIDFSSAQSIAIAWSQCIIKFEVMTGNHALQNYVLAIYEIATATITA